MSLIENGARRIYQVDDLTVDVACARVTRGGVEVVLPKLTFDLLLALIERSPAIVSNDEMMSLVWPGLVISPETLSQRVKLLRAALGDDHRSPRYVAGVRGRGYRLVPEVLRLEPPAQAAVPPANESSRAKAPPSHTMHAWLAGIGALAILALGIAIVTSLRKAPPPPDAGLNLPTRSVAVLPFEALSETPRGSVMALGISEAVLHQLASLRELSVIARTSSFAMAGQGLDARAIGGRLSARYLLEGSVQEDGERLRVTAQLIDASTGEHVWSMRFDRASQDVFKVQDEIAVAVARALELSLDARASDRLRARRAASFEAYLAYLQGRALAATARIGDVRAAAEQFAEAIQADPKFAPAYVELASARVQLAEYELTPDRQQRFEVTRREAQKLVERALELDPAYGEAYAQRAYLQAFSDLAAAERDYRRSIELSPNLASAYAGLAAVLYETADKRDEALQMLERARQRDPLEPSYGVTKAVFLMFWRGQIEAGAAVLREVVERNPLYQPALARYGETLGCLQGQKAEGMKYLEQAIQLDALSAYTISALIHGYADLGEPDAVAQVLREVGGALPTRKSELELYRHDWRAAGEDAYAGFEQRTLMPYDEPQAIVAIRMHARATRDFARARAVLEERARVTWDAKGEPQFPMQTGLATPTVALGDILIASGQAQSGQRLLRASLTDMDRVRKNYGRSDFWYGKDRAIALALLGEDSAALLQVRRAVESDYGRCNWWTFLDIEPAFTRLRQTPEFRQIVDDMRDYVAGERAELQKMRGTGLVPTRP